jgi:class 3 adenylate cyclase/tetratricopeptide (TPR) repeat protein
VLCSVCAYTASSDARFCAQCGTSLATSLSGASGSVERRVVSVLFADLEGFTAFSVDRDHEEVREMLTKYFEVCSRAIALYGGTIEKFIGDAVMAVWGTPVAREDDAERAVKAALDLVASVGDIELEDATHLRLRAGIVTGEVAVTIGARGQGMVAGDVVNTASRLQAKAQAGQVFVDDTTHDATEVAIKYQDGGVHELKGKPEPVHVWWAEGLAAAVHGLEAPFLGREKELRLLKEAFHDATQTRSVRVVTVFGVPGVGKSRLRIEFQRYLDSGNDHTPVFIGYPDSPAAGGSRGALPGVMTQILELAASDTADQISSRIDAMLRSRVASDDERGWFTQRVLQLLMPDTAKSFDRAELFNAWRLLFAAAASSRSLVLIFENAAADSSLSAFLQSMTDLAAPILVLSLTRTAVDELQPALHDHPRIKLNPLGKSVITRMVEELVPDLKPAVVKQLANSAEGIPLYAVEILRTLAAQGLLQRRESTYAIKGILDNVQIPHNIQLLAASRLDSLESHARALVHLCAVVGMRFPATLVGMMQEQHLDVVMPLLARLVQEEILEFEGSSEHEGIYSFTQSLLREVAYSRLSRKERLRLHVRAAEVLPSDDGTAPLDVIANHYLAANDLAPADQGIIEKAKATSMEAAARFATIGSQEEAIKYNELALGLETDEPTKGQLNLAIGQLLFTLARWEPAISHFGTAREIAARTHDPLLDARATVQMALANTTMGKGGESLRLLREAYERLPQAAPDSLRALIMSRLCYAELAQCHIDVAEGLATQACEIFDWMRDGDGMVFPVAVRAWSLEMRGRFTESRAMWRLFAQLARSGPVFTQAFVHCWWAFAEWDAGEFEECLQLADEVANLARALGKSFFDSGPVALALYIDFWQGEWDSALEKAQKIIQNKILLRNPLCSPYPWLARIYSARGRKADSLEMLDSMQGISESVFAYRCPVAQAAVYLDLEDHEKALEIALPLTHQLHNAGPLKFFSDAFGTAATASAEMGNLKQLRDLITLGEAEWPGRRNDGFDGQLRLAQARLAVGEDDEAGARQMFTRAVEVLRRSKQPYELAVALATYARWLETASPVECADPKAEAIQLFESLGATLWISRLSTPHAAASPPGTTATS